MPGCGLDLDEVITGTGSSLAVPAAGCRRAVSSNVADAVNYILQGVLTSGTAAPPAGPGGLSGREAAGKMFGGNAPTSIWHMTFDHANLGPGQLLRPGPWQQPVQPPGTAR